MLLPAILAGLLAAGCGSHAASNGPADRAFLNSVYSQAPDISTYRSADQLLSLAEAVCSDFASGASVQQVADRVPLVEGNVALSPADLGVVMSAAVAELCPKYSKVLEGSG